MIDSDHEQLIKRASYASVVTAVILLCSKLFVWFATGSASILASLTDSFLDIGASIINLFAIKYALEPADDAHRFGHGKAESLAGLVQSAFIVGSSILLMLHGISALLDPQPIVRSELGIAVSIFALLVTFILIRYQTHVVATTGSIAIKADSLHYKSDLWLNATVLIALSLSAYGFYWVDGLATILISCYILYSAYEIGMESIQTLLDHELPGEDIDKITAIVVNTENVLGLHELRTRQSGYMRFIQLHIELDDHLTLFQAHAIADNVETNLLCEFANTEVLIHQDPISIVKTKND
ncbi:cation diffusion facilitator family transporter [Moritella viscosa]|uniref:Predicted Co/Zn/Cd cation transporter n=1 Tax=Moritella viscosa TaxID=80854 RepID=A0ABY1HHU3_9GAMM|nr:cation diffusion facilitator family transporter [Moritella viscosa]CED58209.1 ferrous-iron efflux pump fieF [Moritella viscosa]SGY94380.1 Predicted Co/Zn/Cd cation transporter [Moritella viscosa]SGY99389.1 Predicted Co/Zn/Cd cation transporter [Moritella viscosa]SGY99892.1 Predicted Co/Zn/Cd cation transporter [Moritella viscosa]SGZ06022.1 Predicted Co/Zn/Cd cation transporter [Moritella viscosa]